MRYSLLLLLSASLVFSSAYVFSGSVSENLNVAIAKPAELTVVSSRNGKLRSKNNLQLKASIPDRLSIGKGQIAWVVSKKGKVLHKLTGNDLSLNLAEGLYVVRLGIGKFSDEKEVSIHNGQLIKPYFRAEVGRLNLTANQPVDWMIKGPDGDTYEVLNRFQLDELVPAGNYSIKAMIRDIPIQREIYVKAGQRIKRSISVPVGKVKLIATRDNQPLFQSMEWKVFRLGRSGKRQVGSYHLHSQGITMPPGHYEAVAIHQNTVRKRQFWVQKNTTNKVILGMD